jgi:hypothetical protein
MKEDASMKKDASMKEYPLACTQRGKYRKLLEDSARRLVPVRLISMKLL